MKIRLKRLTPAQIQAWQIKAADYPNHYGGGLPVLMLFEAILRRSLKHYAIEAEHSEAAMSGDENARIACQNSLKLMEWDISLMVWSCYN